MIVVSVAVKTPTRHIQKALSLKISYSWKKNTGTSIYEYLQESCHILYVLIYVYILLKVVEYLVPGIEHRDTHIYEMPKY